MPPSASSTSPDSRTCVAGVSNRTSAPDSASKASDRAGGVHRPGLRMEHHVALEHHARPPLLRLGGGQHLVRHVRRPPDAPRRRARCAAGRSRVRRAGAASARPRPAPPRATARRPGRSARCRARRRTPAARCAPTRARNPASAPPRTARAPAPSARAATAPRRSPHRPARHPRSPRRRPRPRGYRREVTTVREFVTDHRQDLLDDLDAWLRIPGISAQPDHHADVAAQRGVVRRGRPQGRLPDRRDLADRRPAQRVRRVAQRRRRRAGRARLRPPRRAAGRPAEALAHRPVRPDRRRRPAARARRVRRQGPAAVPPARAARAPRRHRPQHAGRDPQAAHRGRGGVRLAELRDAARRAPRPPRRRRRRHHRHRHDRRRRPERGHRHARAGQRDGQLPRSGPRSALGLVRRRCSRTPRPSSPGWSPRCTTTRDGCRCRASTTTSSS